MTDSSDPWAQFKTRSVPGARSFTAPALQNSDEWETFRTAPTNTLGGNEGPTRREAPQQRAARLQAQERFAKLTPRQQIPIHARNIASSVPILRNFIETTPELENYRTAHPTISAGERFAGKTLPYVAAAPIVGAGMIPTAITGAVLEGGDALTNGQDLTNSAITAAIGGGTAGVIAGGARALGNLTGRAGTEILNAPNTVSRQRPSHPLHDTSAPARQAVIDRIEADPGLQQQLATGAPQRYLRTPISPGQNPRQYRYPPMSNVSPELDIGRMTAQDAAQNLNAVLTMQALNKPYRTPTTENVLDVRNIPQIVQGDITSLIPFRPLANWAQRRTAARELANRERALNTATQAEQIYATEGPRAATALEQLYRTGRNQQIGQQTIGPTAEAILRYLSLGSNPVMEKRD